MLKLNIWKFDVNEGVLIMNNNNDNKDIIETMKNIAMSEQKANENLGITYEYNEENRKKLWDSKEDKENYKEEVFDNKETYVDPISGKTLHKSEKAAQNKYHMRNDKGEKVSKKWAEHSAETDHINSIKAIHDITKYNPFLTDEDLKEILNTKDNYRILSKSDNASKGSQSDWDIILNPNNDLDLDAKMKIIKEKIRADFTLQNKLTNRTLKNMGKEFVNGSKETLYNSLIPLTVESINKIFKVINGDETIEEAGKELKKTVLDVAVAGGKNRLILDVINSIIQKSSNENIKKLSRGNLLGGIVTVAMIVNEAAIKYLNGEIDSNEFVNEIGVKGVTLLGGLIGGSLGSELGTILGAIGGTIIAPGAGILIGGVVGKVIGELLGTIVTSVACGTIISIIDTSKHLDDYKLVENKVKRIETEALREMKKQRDKFRTIVEENYKHWDDEIYGGFNMILTCACKEVFDLQGVTDGLDKILNVFGKNVAFKNIDEYEAQLSSTLKLNF